MKTFAMTKMLFCGLMIMLFVIPQHISAQPSSLIKNNDLISLRSVQNNKIVRAGITQDTLLGAASDAITPVWETFRVIKVSNDRIVLILDHSGKIVRAGIGPNTHLAAVVDELVIDQNAWSHFEVESKGGNKVALKSALSGKYVSVTAGPDGLLRAVSDEVGASETFEWVVIGASITAGQTSSNPQQHCIRECEDMRDACLDLPDTRAPDCLPTFNGCRAGCE